MIDWDEEVEKELRDDMIDPSYEQGFLDGAEWQRERLSELLGVDEEESVEEDPGYDLGFIDETKWWRDNPCKCEITVNLTYKIINTNNCPIHKLVS